MTTATVPVQIRAPAPSDEAAWRALWTAYLDFYRTAVPEEVQETTFARLLGDDPQDFHARLACLDGRPVGLVHFLFHRHCWRIENVCYLQDLYAEPAARGIGVGRALIEAVYAAADAAGAPRVYWLTRAGNAPARALYDRVGRATDFIKYDRAGGA